ncbi:hypothetical protein NK553_08630 [Pseudomonas sp. ZM23]|uniref:Glycoside hydrolase family 19 catalytic domain-containing protein n=1 Tax=Pseudomonas triclosanedens TaxID=2961893 RepID=A0ABY7A035_9PSED|nr:glycoside hydrolase family 19 protein [Pseudomonas triclosanedens]MCP8464008.1 hypothetical protein [Pseudomonas triclosanedens]MCP8469092.1 hypothetical protein [Pseudomonas triclosanedens]WAI50481.1 hypothetical protein OU419_04220 [Pseudomonas triclosanedens]
MEKQKKVERWSYPFKAKGEGGAASTEIIDPQVYYDALATAESGYYPVSSNGLWHGGVHFDQNTAGMLDQSSVRCIADGVVVAYRIDESYKKLTYTGSGTPKEVIYSTGFVLVKHRLELPPAPAAAPPAGGTPAPATPPAPEPDLTFYSLYMHLKDWESYKQEGAPTPPAFLCPTQYAVSAEHATNDFAGLYVRGGAPGTPAHANKVSIIPKGCKVQVGAASPINANWRKLVSILEGQPFPALAAEIEHWVFTGEMTPTESDDVFLIGQKANDVQASLLPGKGLTVRKEAKHNSAAMAVLPVGTELQLEDGTGIYRKIKSITASSLSAPVSPECAANIQGFVHFDSLKAVPLPPTLNTVHVLPEPAPITAGALIGHLGKYQAASQGQAHDLLHLEVFTCDDIEAFITKSRARAEQLKPEQKTLLKIPSETKVIDKPGASKDNPPQPSDPGNPTAYDMIFPLAVLNALPADRKITLSTTAGGTTTTQQWWKLDNLPGKDGNPLSGWVKEDEIITPRLHPWSWEGFDFIKETSTLSDQYVCKLRADGVLDDGEKTNYKAQVNENESFIGGPIQKRLFEIIDIKEKDGRLTPEEIRDALSKPWHAQSISRLIAQYESEWYADEGLSKWEALNFYMADEGENDWVKEKKRINSLLWWRNFSDDKKSQESADAWHFQPIALTSSFSRPQKQIITVELIEKVFSKTGDWFTGRGGSNSFMQEFPTNYPDIYKYDKEEFVAILNSCLEKYQINTPYYQAHFLSQCFHESARFETTLEFGSGANYNPGVHPSAVANENTEIGDGPKYRGRGLIQLTWKKNYRKYSEYRGINFVSHPELVATDMHNAIDASCWFWRNAGAFYQKYDCKGDINILIDNEKDNVELITKAVNGGSNGLSERAEFFHKIKTEWELN